MSSVTPNKSRWLAAVAVVVALQTLGMSTATGQSVPNDERVAGATRNELEARSASLERELRSDSVSQTRRDSLSVQAQEIERRLREGDFAPGDRIVLHMQGEQMLNDTLTVRGEQVLPVPGFPDLALRGVLRSELRERVHSHLARYLRDPQFSVVPLIRDDIVGEVTRPGFYSLPPDARIADAIMLAGGPTGNGDLGRLTLSHGGRRLLAELQMRDIVARGLSLDDAGVVPGDEVLVGQRPHRDTQVYFQVGTVLLSALSTFLAYGALSRRH